MLIQVASAFGLQEFIQAKEIQISDIEPMAFLISSLARRLIGEVLALTLRTEY